MRLIPSSQDFALTPYTDSVSDFMGSTDYCGPVLVTLDPGNSLSASLINSLADVSFSSTTIMTGSYTENATISLQNYPGTTLAVTYTVTVIEC